MRRQFGVGGAIPAGSGRVERLDPHFLPVKFDTRDARADGGIRQVEISSEHITIRRAVRNARMTLSIRVGDYLGIALRETEDGYALILAHRDPSLSVPLAAADSAGELGLAAMNWMIALGVSRIDADRHDDGPFHYDCAPAQRRRRHSTIKSRRPRILMRRKTGSPLRLALRHSGEREIIARS